MRELTLEELELVAGGTDTIVVTGDRGDYGDWGDYGDDSSWYDSGDYGDGGGGGSDTGAPGPSAIEFIDACPVEAAEATRSLNLLYDNSPTARALIDAVVANGTDLNLITASLSGFGAQDTFQASTNQIMWDPFMYVQGTNLDGTTYTEAPIMLLAHELVHAGHAGDPSYQGAGSETLVMSIANQIAAEMNAATGSSYETNRTSHDGTRYNTTSSTSTTYSISRPGCQ